MPTTVVENTRLCVPLQPGPVMAREGGRQVWKAWFGGQTSTAVDTARTLKGIPDMNPDWKDHGGKWRNLGDRN
jgi:hypothetical protein